MQVELALFGKLSARYPVPGSGREPHPLHVAERTTVGALIERTGLAAEPRIAFVNGRHALDDRLLAPGDRLAVFPPVAGARGGDAHPARHAGCVDAA